MNRKKKDTLTVKSAGRTPDDRENCSNSYVIINRCSKCPLWVFIDLVCHYNLSALIVEGNPPESALNDAKMDLLSEFAELSGNKSNKQITDNYKSISLYRAKIVGLSICIDSLSFGELEKIKPFISMNGIRLKGNETYEMIQRKIESKIKFLDIKLREEMKRYEVSISNGTGKKISSDHFTEQLVQLSKHAGFRLTTDIMLSEYAAYLKDFQKEIDYAKQRANTTKRA